MDRIDIRGGNALNGRLPISGAKNAALTLLPCALLTDEPVTLRNLPRLADVDSFGHLLNQLGVSTMIEGARPEDIRAAEAQWRRAQAVADLAQTTYQRTERLFEQGVLAGQKRDESRANALASNEAARAARAQYDLALAGARRQDRQAASGQVRQARGALAEVEAAEKETRVFAPSDGEIGRRLAQSGELVPQGFPVFVLTDIDHPWVTLTLREDQFSAIRRGRVLTGRIPALGDRCAQFRVFYIALAGDFATWRATRQSSGFDVKSFDVRLSPVSRVDGLRPGMTVLFDWPQ